MSFLLYLSIPIYIIVFSKQINKKKFNIIDYTLIIIMSFICGFRENVGTDYLLYDKMYNNIVIFPRVELGFKWIINQMNTFGLSSTYFFFLTSFVTIILFYYMIKKNASKPADSLFLFVCMGYFSLQFNIIRQSLAIAISLYSVRYINGRNIIKFSLLILLATLCHTTAIIMIPFYFLNKMEISRKNIFVILISMLMFSFLYNPIINTVVKYLPTYEVYLTINDYTYNPAGLGTYLILLFNLVLLLLVIINKNKLIEYNSKNRVLINMILFSFFFYFLSLANTVVVRPAYYLSVYFIFLLPDLYYLSKIRKNLNNLLIILVIFLLYYILHIAFFNTMVPYHSILF